MRGVNRQWSGGFSDEINHRMRQWRTASFDTEIAYQQAEDFGLVRGGGSPEMDVRRERGLAGTGVVGILEGRSCPITLVAEVRA